MPVVPTYPGVYVEEIPSGVRTITGVATSITAFIGFASRGLTNEPIRIQNFGSFERIFGGLSLHKNRTMGYAVQQFFLNGGSDALIIRLSNPGNRAVVELNAPGGRLILESLEPGREFNDLEATITHNGEENFTLVLVLGDGDNAIREEYADIAISDLKEQLSTSNLVRIQPDSTIPDSRPNEEANKTFEGGFDPANTAQYPLPVSKNSDGGDIDEEIILAAASEGLWGNNLQISVDYVTSEPSRTFNLTVALVEDKQEVASETLRNLSIDETDTRYFVDVIETQSSLIRVFSIPENEENMGRPDITETPIKMTDANPNEGSDGGVVPKDLPHIYIGSLKDKTGLYALEKAPLFNLLCISPVTRTVDISDSTWATAASYCLQKRAMVIIDPPLDWATKELAIKGVDSLRSILGDAKKNAAVFFPRVKLANPLKENRSEVFVPSGIMAGLFARTDTNRGVWKAPAGTEAGLTGVRELTLTLTDDENGLLNPIAVNCLRNFPVYGNVAWGSRTLDGADQLASEWKYIPVRRLALFLEESLYRGTQWVVFEPNDEPLWAQIRLNIGAFMNNLFKQGAFQGKSAREAYFVKCDSETTTQNDIDRGIVNIIIGYAPLKPAEFVILKFQQIAGQLET